MKNEIISNLREDYKAKSFRRTDLVADPYAQFNAWFEEALNAKIPEPNAMTLATASLSGRPSARVVLLKSIVEDGFIFYTNYESTKGKMLAENPQAALVFCWLELERQIRIEGRVEKVDTATSEAYFQSRPKKSQLGAWVSQQSTVIKARTVLEENMTELQAQYAAQAVLPKPPHWGGYKVIPDKIEFWQGRSSRLHDRFQYTLQADGQWIIERLAP
ncbi:MAG: pyridoxamine 5'-phosphate oxidase [Saprospiraceae bacterium]